MQAGHHAQLLPDTPPPADFGKGYPSVHAGPGTGLQDPGDARTARFRSLPSRFPRTTYLVSDNRPFGAGPATSVTNPADAAIDDPRPPPHNLLRLRGHGKDPGSGRWRESSSECILVYGKRSSSQIIELGLGNLTLNYECTSNHIHSNHGPARSGVA